jgi:hypothetical protein
VEEKRLSPEELAERENVPLTTILAWNRNGTGPQYMRLSRQTIRYRLTDVIEWENSRVVASAR